MATMSIVSKTRVCIKNLPPSACEQDVKEFLQESSKQRRLEITDVKVLRNSKGKSRKVAFVGFRHEDQASYVIDTFHRSFMGMSRLSVEAAIPKKNEEASKEDTKQEINAAPVQTNEKESKHKKEILELFGAGQKSKFWANDEEAPPELQPESSDVEDKNNEDEGDSDSSDSSSSSSSNEGAAAEDNPEKQSSTAVSDLDFLRSKQKATDNLEASEEQEPVERREQQMDTDSEDGGENAEDDSSSSASFSNDDRDAENAIGKQQDKLDRDEGEDEDSNKDEERSASRLFIRNLPFDTTEEELEDYFSTYGKLLECHIPVDDRKRNKGFAFVQYANAVDALEARKQLDKVDFQGRLLHVLSAKPAPAQAHDNENLTWKQKQEKARKEQDTKNGEAKGWSASFVRGDAVVDNLADRLGLRKADFLGVKEKLSSGDAAVRLALAETQIIEENREYFKRNGVDMDALVLEGGKDANRSKTSILVKNLPYDTSVDELAKLFQVGDQSVKILLPPSRTIALVHYGHHSDAKKAFRKLAYRRFKHVPIYLEWAPMAAQLSDSKSQDTLLNTSQNLKNSLVGPIEDADIDSQDGPVSTIYVKNLNFATSEDTLREVFEKNVGPVRSVRIPKKVAPAKNGEEIQQLSMGYGFVELESESSIKKALEVLQGKLVEGHSWEVTVSSKKTSAQSKLSSSPKNPTKLIVRNVPFQATRTEILNLFGTFGQLRKVRLPKKFDGSHRGFAFVEFLTSKEALAAMNSLSRTHLYGRHLVLEWATDDDQDITRLREKAKRDSDATTVQRNKKIRFN